MLSLSGRIGGRVLLAAMLFSVLATAGLAPAESLGTTPDETRPTVAPDRDGELGEELSILERARDYNRRHGITGEDAIPRLVERARWSLAERRAQSADKAIEGDGWISLGPVNGAGRCVAVAPHPTDAGTLLYVSLRCGAECPGDLARIMRSEDGGTTWVAAVNGLPPLTNDASRNRTSLAAAPSNDQILYAGFNLNGTATNYYRSGLPIAVIYRSTDGGLT